MCDRIFMIFRGRKVLDGTLDEIQASYGSDTMRVRTEGGAARARRHRGGRRRSTTTATLQEVRLSRADPQAFLAALVAPARGVSSFEITRPSLHDIFVRIARPAARSVA